MKGKLVRESGKLAGVEMKVQPIQRGIAETLMACEVWIVQKLCDRGRCSDGRVAGS